MKWLGFITALAVVIALYVTIIRPYLATTESGKKFLAAIEPIEYTLFRKSETILWSRFKVLIGTLLTIATTTNLDVFAPLVGDKYRPLIAALPTIALMLDGIIGEALRRDTTKPLDVVSMRTDAPEELKTAAADAAAVNKEVVAEIRAAGAA